MAILENVATTFFHGTRTNLPVGTVLKSQKTGYVQGSGFDEMELAAHKMCEAILEDLRPSSAVSRIGAIFMCDDPTNCERAGGYDDYVFEVQPQGPVSKANLFWYSELESYCYNFDSVREMDWQDCQEMAKGYWNCLPNNVGEPHRDLVEYVTQTAVILRPAGG